MEQYDKKSILQMAKGAIEERVDVEMAKLVDNIMDENTKATTARKLTLTVEIKPDDERKILQVSATAKSTLAPTNPVATSLYMARVGGEVQAVEMVPQIPGQQYMDGGEQEQPAMLKVVNFNNH
jgi:hypothetical protein